MKFSLLLDSVFDPMIENKIIEKENHINEIVNQLGITSKRVDRRADVWNIAKFVLENYPQAEFIEATDSPDLVIKNNNKYIGIEHTRLLNDELKKYIRSTRNILNKAANLYSQRYPDEPPILVNIGFKDVFLNMKKLELEEKCLIEEIINHVRSIRLKLGNEFHSINEIKEILPNLHYKHITNQYSSKSIFSEICFITPSSTTNEFNLFTFYENTPLSVERLQREVTKKEKYLGKYRYYEIRKLNNKLLDEIWLLLVISDGSPETAFEINYRNYNKIQTDFDKVFILNDFEGKVYGIKS